MNTGKDKSRTIKIDIRSHGYGRMPSSGGQEGVAEGNYFDALDYRFLFEQAYDAILLADAAGRVLAANERAVRFFGGEGGLSGTSIRTLIAGVTDRLLGDIQTVIAEGRYMRIQAYAARSDGTFVPVEIIVMGNRVKAPEQVCYLIRDIQSRWTAEQKLLSAHHAMDNTDAGIGIVNLEGKIVYANRTLVSLLANGDETALLEHGLSLWFDRRTVVEPMFAKIEKFQPWSGEQQMISEAVTTWLSISAVPDINDDQELSGVVIAVRDAAERRRAETAEYQVERNRIMMESLAGVCHALGQPATVLLTSIEIMKLQGVSDPKTLKEMIDLCYEAVIQLRDLLQKMNAKRMYASEPYLPSGNKLDGIVRLDEGENSDTIAGGGRQDERRSRDGV